MKKVAISQSNYIPWKGYFDMINHVDTFVVFDEVQFTRRDWRNRNKIKNPSGTTWLTIPVDSKGKYHQKISETQVNDPTWAEKHWQTISNLYRKAPYFKDYSEPFEKTYALAGKENLLSAINLLFIETINELLGIKTTVLSSADFTLADDQTKRLLNICIDLNADIYISGPAAKNYLKIDSFNQEGIEVEWMDYSGYIDYNQMFGVFSHEVTILDLLFNVGPNARKYMKSFTKPTEVTTND